MHLFTTPVLGVITKLIRYFSPLLNLVPTRPLSLLPLAAAEWEIRLISEAVIKIPAPSALRISQMTVSLFLTSDVPNSSSIVLAVSVDKGAKGILTLAPLGITSQPLLQPLWSDQPKPLNSAEISPKAHLSLSWSTLLFDEASRDKVSWSVNSERLRDVGWTSSTNCLSPNIKVLMPLVFEVKR